LGRNEKGDFIGRRGRVKRKEKEHFKQRATADKEEGKGSTPKKKKTKPKKEQKAAGEGDRVGHLGKWVGGVCGTGRGGL